MPTLSIRSIMVVLLHRARPVPGRWCPWDGAGAPFSTPGGVLDSEESTSAQGEPVVEIVGVRLDRVRKPLDVGQVRQIPLYRRDRNGVVAEHRVQDSTREAGIIARRTGIGPRPE
jgi:hypothetical protein